MPDISSNETKASLKTTVDQAKLSTFHERNKINDQSGLIIFKHHKNKKSKIKNKMHFDRRLASQSYESGLNVSLKFFFFT